MAGDILPVAMFYSKRTNSGLPENATFGVGSKMMELSKYPLRDLFHKLGLAGGVWC